MEKRGLTLKGVLVRYLIFSGGTCAVLALLWLFGLALLINMGVLFPANAGAQSFSQAVSRVTEYTADTFSPDLVPPPCRYALIQGNDVLFTNAQGGYLRALQEYLAGESEGLTNRVRWYTQYYNAVRLADGTVCLFQYDYAVHWCTPELQNTLPDFQTMHLLSLAAVCLGAVALYTRRSARIVARDAALLTDAGAKLAAGDASELPANTAKVREFRRALDTMDRMRGQLAESLRAQWVLEQRRREDMACLAHDLKTPLTVITGNGELLAEDILTADQRRSVEAVLRSAQSALEYVDRMQALARADGEPSPRTPVCLAAFTNRCAQTGRGLCAARKLRFVCRPGPDTVFEAREEDLCRAVANLLDNAARFAQTCVKLRVEMGEGQIRFCVEDDGPGFSPAALQRAGRSLYTGDASRPQSGHTGMGLWFARAVALEHGGGLELFNADGACAVLTVRL